MPKTKKNRKAGQQTDPPEGEKALLPRHHRQSQRPNDQNRQKCGERLGHRHARLRQKDRIDGHQHRRDKRPTARKVEYQRQTVDNHHRHQPQNPVQKGGRVLLRKKVKGARIAFIRRRRGEDVKRAQKRRIERRTKRRRRLPCSENAVSAHILSQRGVSVRIGAQRPSVDSHRRLKTYNKRQKEENADRLFKILEMKHRQTLVVGVDFGQRFKKDLHEQNEKSSC